MNFEIKFNSEHNTLTLTMGGETKVFNVTEVTDKTNDETISPDKIEEKEDIKTEQTELTVMTWNNQNWSIKKNHVKSITAEQTKDYANKVREMLHSIDGCVPNLLGMQEYGVVFDLAGNYATNTALIDYPECGQFEWLKNGKKADYWAPGGFVNNSSMVNGVESKLLYDTLWLWGSEATISKCKKNDVKLLYYYDKSDGLLNVPTNLKESDVKTPISEFAHVLELNIGSHKVAWANVHLFPKSTRKDYPYNKDVVNWMCLKNLMYVLHDYNYVIISGDFNWDNKRFMLTYDEAVSLNNNTKYPIVNSTDTEVNRYMYAGCGKEGYVTADYALLGYGMAGVKRGENGETDVDRLNTVDSIIVKGFDITKVRKLNDVDWFDKDHRPVFAKLKIK